MKTSCPCADRYGWRERDQGRPSQAEAVAFKEVAFKEVSSLLLKQLYSLPMHTSR